EAVRRATVAVPVEQSAAHELRRLVPALAFEQLRQVERLLAEALPADDRDTGAALVAHHGERAAAAHEVCRNVDVEAGRLALFDGGDTALRLDVVRQRVRPEPRPPAARALPARREP